MPCCTDQGRCGVTEDGVLDFAPLCLDIDQEGNPDPTCPDDELDVGGVPAHLDGCCRPDDHCGLDLSIISAGCVAHAEAVQVKAAASGSKPIGDVVRLCTY